jgi:hypothetical protein
LASKKFLNIILNKEQPNGKEDKIEYITQNQDNGSTFFFMGMDIPIEMTDALKSLDERSLKNPF